MDSRINGKNKDRSFGGFLDLIKRRFRIPSFLVVFAAVFTLAAVPPPPASAEIVDRIVAVVNDSVITLSELKAAMALAGDEAGEKSSELLPTGVELKSRVLDSLIEQKLIRQASDRAGIEISEIEIDKAVDSVLEKNGITEDALLVALAESGLTLSEYREQLRERLREQKFINAQFRSKVVLSSEEIEEYYTQNLEKYYRAPALRLAIIFFSNSDEELLDKKLKIVRRGLEAGEAFAKLAREYSEGPAVEEGGDLGLMNVNDFDSVIAEVAERLDEGDVSEPILGPKGVTFIKVIEKKLTEVRPLEELKNDIYQELYALVLEEKFSSWLKESRVFSHIEVRL